MNKKIFILAVILVIFLAGGITLIVDKKDNEEELINPVVKQYQDQAREYESKVKKDPENPETIRKYAVALYATGKLDEAIEWYQKEMQINPNDAELFNNLANIYRDKGDYSQAELNYRKSIEIKKTDDTAYNNLASLYLYQMGDKQKAIEIYEELVQNNPDNGNAKKKLEELKK